MSSKHLRSNVSARQSYDLTSRTLVAVRGSEILGLFLQSL